MDRPPPSAFMTASLRVQQCRKPAFRSSGSSAVRAVDSCDEKKRAAIFSASLMGRTASTSIPIRRDLPTAITATGPECELLKESPELASEACSAGFPNSFSVNRSSAAETLRYPAKMARSATRRCRNLVWRMGDLKRAPAACSAKLRVCAPSISAGVAAVSRTNHSATSASPSE